VHAHIDPDRAAHYKPRVRRLLSSFAGVAVCLLAGHTHADDDAPRRRLRAEPLGVDTITIDGRLDEPAWSRAPAGTGFVERSPRPGATPPADSEVRVLYDAEAIYVGVRMRLVEGETPRGLALALEDFRLWSDDAVTLKFDVQRDRRNVVGFAINVSGARLDFLALENGAVFRREYDAVWEGAAGLEEGAWIAEFRLPAAALGLPRSDGERIMGFNVSRDHNLRHATDDWSHLPPAYGAMAARYFGDLEGVQGIAGGRPLALVPYGLVGYPSDGDLPVRLRAGGDARLRISQDIWGEATVLTDFAQVDVDDAVVNLDRFPLFLPEKRPFFLNGLDVFEFGASGQAQPFFSRRIGLDPGGEEIPLWTGLKLYGHDGPLSFGVLNAITGGGLDSDVEQEATNFSVARGRLNLTDDAHLGVIAVGRHGLTGRSETEADPDHYAFGVDGLARLAENLELTAFGAGTVNVPVEEGAESSELGNAARLGVRWRGDTWRPSVGVLRVDDAFAPAVGFVRRTDILTSDASLEYVLRPSNLVGLAEIAPTVRGSWTTRADATDRVGAAGGGGVYFSWENGWGVGVYVDAIEDVVDEDFDLVPGKTAKAGRYLGVGTDVTLNTPGRRNPKATFRYNHGDGFFGGTSELFSVDGELAMGRHVTLNIVDEARRIDLPDETPFWTNTVNAGLGVTPDNLLLVDFLAQHENVADRFLGLVRVRWRYLPGSDLFLVYREALDVGGDGDVEEERSITLKATWRYDTVL
jgi:hypothetical protein